jgi:hypothetical protein
MAEQLPTGRSSSAMNVAAAIGVIAIVIVGAFVLLAIFRGPGDQRAGTQPSGSPASTAVASSSASAATSTTAPPSSTATSTTPAATSSDPAGVAKPDAAHGLITFTNLRTENDAKDLQQPPQFTRSPGAVPFTEGIGVSPDGREVALVRTGQTGQQLITFTTSKPNDVNIVIDFAGSGEFAGGLVWAGDGARSVLIAVHKLIRPSPVSPTEYSSLRVVDVGTKQVREIARIVNGASLFPIAWRSDRRVAAALEITAGSAQSYDLARDGAPLERAALDGSYGPVTASRDGLRVVAVFSPGPDAGVASIRWWPIDQLGAAKTINAPTGMRLEIASFRPGSPDELGVSVGPPCCAAGQGVPPPGHFEIWNVATGQQRVVNANVGFALWRADGSAALIGATLIDPVTGGTTQLPGGAFKIADVVLF